MIKLDRKIVVPRTKYNLPYQSVVLYQPSIMDKVLEPRKVMYNGREVTLANPQRDVSVFYNQERLNGFNPQMILDYFTSNETSSKLAELRSKCTDEQLISMCKSRFIQTQTELELYFDHLSRSYDSEVKSLIEQQKQESADTETTTTETETT